MQRSIVLSRSTCVASGRQNVRPCFCSKGSQSTQSKTWTHLGKVKAVRKFKQTGTGNICTQIVCYVLMHAAACVFPDLSWPVLWETPEALNWHQLIQIRRSFLLLLFQKEGWKRMNDGERSLEKLDCLHMFAGEFGFRMHSDVFGRIALHGSIFCGTQRHVKAAIHIPLLLEVRTLTKAPDSSWSLKRSYWFQDSNVFYSSF